MKKKILLRSLLGAPIGVAISYLITAIISLAVADGNYYPVVPELALDCGGELNAVLLQVVLSLLYGAVWGGASVIWEMERWSLLRMTLSHLILCSAATFPIAYFTRWLPRSAGGLLLYFGVFFAIYLGIWLSQYCVMKKRIEKLNQKVQEKEQK